MKDFVAAALIAICLIAISAQAETKGIEEDEFIMFLFVNQTGTFIKYWDGPCETAWYEVIPQRNVSCLRWLVNVSCGTGKNASFISDPVAINKIGPELRLVPLYRNG
ncbi:MAG TPA: hypothetical protein P5080_00455 [Candidatus Paceibacterota bacterium]|nr:hypothetical protein [Candidatus Pacearchaeota archaeon]HRZ50446.1 hypothetical protein [Candidatus Paceibacterota bacterium]HSA36167.1 hypothetical protein [Candidatus Paceibacterota bacterium]